MHYLFLKYAKSDSYQIPKEQIITLIELLQNKYKVLWKPKLLSCRLMLAKKWLSFTLRRKLLNFFFLVELMVVVIGND